MINSMSIMSSMAGLEFLCSQLVGYTGGYRALHGSGACMDASRRHPHHTYTYICMVQEAPPPPHHQHHVTHTFCPPQCFHSIRSTQMRRGYCLLFPRQLYILFTSHASLNPGQSSGKEAVQSQDIKLSEQRSGVTMGEHHQLDNRG